MKAGRGRPIRRSLFQPEEDKLLVQIVSHSSQLPWSTIAARLPGRTARQCRDHWNHYLGGPGSERPWSIEEDLLIWRLATSGSPRWSD
jgi:hypothetical protein